MLPANTPPVRPMHTPGLLIKLREAENWICNL
jgi:hypothetical protein